MKNFFTLILSLGLLSMSGGTAWILVTLSSNVEISATDPGNAAQVVVP